MLRKGFKQFEDIIYYDAILITRKIKHQTALNDDPYAHT